MSTLRDETAADVPVKDVTVDLSRLTPAPAESSPYQHARPRQDISRVSREELEDRFLRLQEETLQLKQDIHKRDDMIKKLSTKLTRLKNNRGRMEQLAAGTAPSSRVRDVEMEEMMEELHEKVRALQAENEGLKQRLLVAKHQLVNSQSQRPTPYDRIQPRVNTGLKKFRDDVSSPSLARPKSTRSLEGGGRPPTGLLPRFGHSLLEEARAEIRNLENVIESQRSRMEELEGASELLREELRRKEAEYEERLLQVRQEQTSKLRTHVNSNVMLIKLQKQLAARSNTVAELEGRYLQLQESQQTLKLSHEAAMAKVDELSADLKNERLKSLELEKQLQSASIARMRMEQLQERIGELEQERDLLKDSNEKLLNSAFDVSQEEKWQLQEQQLKLQISQLETALKADLVDKNEILDKVKAERDTNEKLKEANQKLEVQFLQQKQQLEELNERLKFYSRGSDYDVAELTEALLLVKTRKSQTSGDLGFLREAEEETGSTSMENAVKELRAAHAETIQELEKTRSLLSMENRISQGYKAELDAALRKMDADKLEYDQKLERQAQLLDARATKIRKLEAQLRDIAYGTKTYSVKVDATAEDEADESAETVHLEGGENLLELQIVGVTLSDSALQMLGEAEPATFCTYAFYVFELHATPVMTGRSPKYDFTSKYVVSVDDHFLDYLHRGAVRVELHEALGLDWRTLAAGELRLQQLLEQDGKVHGSVALVGSRDEARSFGSLEFWLRLRVPMMETLRLYREKMKGPPPTTSGWNELFITVRRCSGLQPRGSRQPSPYVVYKFFHFPDHPTATVHDRQDPDFNDLRSFSVSMDADLDWYLKSELLQFYVFDYKEEQMDTYLGKAGVPLRTLTHDESLTGVFLLADPSGLPAGNIEVTLKWKVSYIHPVDAMEDEPRFTPVEETSEAKRQPEGEDTRRHPAESQAPLPKPRPKTQVKGMPPAKKVTFVEGTAANQQLDALSSAARGAETLPAGPVQVLSKGAAEEEDNEGESEVSEGQLVAVIAASYSDDSEISEEIIEDVEDVPAAAEDSAQSDSDDCIVPSPATARKVSERVRVEIMCLSLRAESRVARDTSVVRLFVEYSFLDLPTEETPLSLPKPPPGHSINYNYSKVIPVDAEKNAARRRLLRGVLQGRNPHMERIRFTVVSEPPEEEEQERECEDVGVAFLRIPDILEKRRDVTEERLNVLDVEDSSEVVGTLTVSMEGLEALRSIMEEEEEAAQAV
ncbi:protein fantom [Oreochromis aureus]|uniref:C2 domain-containing protein n=1 Tax=Oreochromis aureus TaxID=47969 RepID=A0A668RZE0_OREAU|nr:protein fantom [Oreochromis aureus]XP_031607653.1 protein fantom [Oreochromis aureus]